MATTPDLSGRILGQYEIRQRIGVGGMAAVYRAYQSKLRRDVALKILPDSLAENPEYEERFEREASTAAALEHPHIVPIFDYGTDHGISYVAMRLLGGGSLGDRMANRERQGADLPSMAEIGKLLTQIGGALDYAHNQGVIHRDIKPSNIMFDDQGNPFIVDFGIAKVLHSTSGVTATGQAMGTPAFMAPEQWRAEVPSAATDQYAIGILTYSVITGRIPFEAPTPFGLMHLHMNEIPTAPSLMRADIPDALNDVINRAMAKRAEDRYPSISEFAQEFVNVVGAADSMQTNFFTFNIPQRTFGSDKLPSAPRTGGSAAEGMPTYTPSGSPVAPSQPPVLSDTYGDMIARTPSGPQPTSMGTGGYTGGYTGAQPTQRSPYSNPLVLGVLLLVILGLLAGLVFLLTQGGDDNTNDNDNNEQLVILGLTSTAIVEESTSIAATQVAQDNETATADAVVPTATNTQEVSIGELIFYNNTMCPSFSFQLIDVATGEVILEGTAPADERRIFQVDVDRNYRAEVALTDPANPTSPCNIQDDFNVTIIAGDTTEFTSAIYMPPRPRDPDTPPNESFATVTLINDTECDRAEIVLRDERGGAFRFAADDGETVTRPYPIDFEVGFDIIIADADDRDRCRELETSGTFILENPQDTFVYVVTFDPQPTVIAQDTQEPTEVVTEVATSEPTEIPTEAPTDAPVELATEAPIGGDVDGNATDVPSEVETEAPTATTTEAALTDTPDPTATDTAEPSPTATVAPTDTPSPTATATFTDTPSPTATFTDTPSPTVVPTDTPTNTPSPSSTTDGLAFVDPAFEHLSANFASSEVNRSNTTSFNFDVSIFSNAFLDCPPAGVDAGVNSTNGYTVTIDYNGRQYDYRLSLDGSVVIYCENRVAHPSSILPGAATPEPTEVAQALGITLQDQATFVTSGFAAFLPTAWSVFDTFQPDPNTFVAQAANIDIFEAAQAGEFSADTAPSFLVAGEFILRADGPPVSELELPNTEPLEINDFTGVYYTQDLDSGLDVDLPVTVHGYWLQVEDDIAVGILFYDFGGEANRATFEEFMGAIDVDADGIRAGFAAATIDSSLAYGDTRRILLDDDNPTVTFSFEGEAGDRITINAIADEPDELDTYLTLLDSDAQVLFENDNIGDSNNARIEYTLPEDGNYSIRLSAQSGSGDVILGLAEGVGEVQAIQFGDTLTGNISDAAPTVGYTFVGEAGDTILIDMTADDTGALDTYLTLLGPDETVIFENDDSGGTTNSQIVYTLPESGTYTIIAGRYAEGTGDFSLTLTAGQLPTTGEPGSIATDGVEILNAPSPDANVLSTGIAGIAVDIIGFLTGTDGETWYRIVVATDGFVPSETGYVPANTIDSSASIPQLSDSNDGLLALGDSEDGAVTATFTSLNFSFEGTANTNVIIEMIAEDTALLDPFLQLIGPDGAVIAEDDDGAGNLNARIIFTLPDDGTYTIRATRYGGAGNFTVTLSDAGDAPVSSSAGATDGGDFIVGVVGTGSANAINMRGAPSVSAEVVATVDPGSAVAIYGSLTNAIDEVWYRLDYEVDGNPISGYIRSDLVEAEEDVDPFPTQTTSTSALNTVTAPVLEYNLTVDDGGNDNTLAFNRDGSRYALAQGPTVRLFDSSDGDEVLAFTAAGRVNQVRWSSPTIITTISFVFGDPAPSYVVELWNATTGQNRLTLPFEATVSDGFIDGYAISADVSLTGDLLAVMFTDGRVTTYDADNGFEIWSSQAHQNFGNNVLFNPTGLVVSSVSIQDGTVVHQSSFTGDVLSSVDINAVTGDFLQPFQIRYSRNGLRYAVLTNEAILVFDATNDELLSITPIESPNLDALPAEMALSPDGEVALVRYFSYDRVDVIDLTTSQRVFSFVVEGQASGVAVSDNGLVAASAAQATVIFSVPAN